VELLFQKAQIRPRQNTTATVPSCRRICWGCCLQPVKVLVRRLSSPWTRPRIPIDGFDGIGGANLLFNGLTTVDLGATGLALGTTVGGVGQSAILRLWFGAAWSARRANRPWL